MNSQRHLGNFNGWTILETSFVALFSLPILALTIAFIDYTYCKITLRHFTSTVLAEVDIPLFKLSTGDQGLFLGKNTSRLDTEVQARHDHLTSRLEGEFGANYYIETGFAFYQIDKQHGFVKQFANWGDGQGDPKHAPHDPALNIYKSGSIEVPFGNPSLKVGILEDAFEALIPQSVYEPSPNEAFRGYSTPAGTHGAYRQNNYGPSYLYPGGVTASNYFRTSAVIATYVAVDVKDRPAGLLAKCGLAPQLLTEIRMVNPRGLL